MAGEKKSAASYIGENIYKVEGFAPTGTDVVDAWYAEIEDYKYGRIGNVCTGGITGHFTQVMWSMTREIGCGRHLCNGRGSGRVSHTHSMSGNGNGLGNADDAHAKNGYDETNPIVTVSCRYFPGGNIVSQLPFGGLAASKLGVGASPC